MNRTSQRLFIVFLVGPALLILLAVVFYPFLYNVVISFSNRV